MAPSHETVTKSLHDGRCMTQTIELIYFNAGGGHRAAALALDAVLRERGGRLEVRCTNVMDVLDPTGRFNRITGMAP